MIKEVPLFHGYYADDLGNVYSNKTGQMRMLSKRLHKGYYRVNLIDSHPKKLYPTPVHTIIPRTFVGERGNDEVCRHLNGNALDNRLVNLCWGTQKENAADAKRHGTAVCLRHGEQANGSKLSLQEVLEIKRMRNEGVKLKEIASAFSISMTHVRDIAKGRTWKKDAP